MTFTLFFSGLIGLPISSIPCVSAVNPVAVASYVRVRLLGVGPGKYFDLTRFSFPVPTSGPVSAENTDTNAPTAHIATTYDTHLTPRWTDFITPFTYVMT